MSVSAFADTAISSEVTSLSYIQKLYQERDDYRCITEALRLKESSIQLIKKDELNLILAACYFRRGKYIASVQTLKEVQCKTEKSLQDCENKKKVLNTASYLSLGMDQKAEHVWGYISLSEGDPLLPVEKNLPTRKNPETARWLSAFLPGAGLFYTGEYQNGAVSFVLNALFLAGISHYYQEEDYGITMLLTFFEIGWYQGGINAAAEAAENYNRRQKEKMKKEWLHFNLLQVAF